MSSSSSSPPSKTLTEEKFSEFYAKWMDQLEQFLQVLAMAYRRTSNNQVDYQAMVDKLTAHHKEYYSFKWAAAREDVLAFYAPVWLTPMENAYQWVTGWKPSTAFRVAKSVAGVTEEQGKKIEALRLKVKVEEDRVEREMERQQVAVAGRKMVDLMRRRVGEGEVEAVKGVAEGMERVMRMADCVRMKTLKGVMDALSPVQCVVFLASMAVIHVRIRKLGMTMKTTTLP
ncbi:protein DOG1-like 4 [Andrographis paniculata]|uniref:protein DOG1-like 4 n=1 Tax=Andrographis paniculata TaxID=175694 RepID=UPI0021E6DE40|nr:protein DOG1-like 4 [Andrographis paniculata]